MSVYDELRAAESRDGDNDPDPIRPTAETAPLGEHTDCFVPGYGAVEHCNGSACRDPDEWCEHCGCCQCTPCEYARVA